MSYLCCWVVCGGACDDDDDDSNWTGSGQALKSRLKINGKFPVRTEHTFTQYSMCKGGGPGGTGGLSKSQCYQRVSSTLDDFFGARKFMWPTFAGNGFDVKG